VAESADERTARLTELAQRVYLTDEHHLPGVYTLGRGAAVLTDGQHNMMTFEGPRALDAIEAALRALADVDGEDDHRCPVHADQVHGREAEELRAGIENILRAFDPSEDDDVQRIREQFLHLLDDVDARDSLAWLERRDAAALDMPCYHCANGLYCPLAGTDHGLRPKGGAHG